MTAPPLVAAPAPLPLALLVPSCPFMRVQLLVRSAAAAAGTTPMMPAATAPFEAAAGLSVAAITHGIQRLVQRCIIQRWRTAVHEIASSGGPDLCHVAELAVHKVLLLELNGGKNRETDARAKYCNRQIAKFKCTLRQISQSPTSGAASPRSRAWLRSVVHREAQQAHKLRECEGAGSAAAG